MNQARSIVRALVAALTGLVVGSGAFGDAAAALPVPLTPAEHAYVAHHPVVTMCVDPDWIPFERINPAGEHEGIAADLVQLVAREVGLKIELVPTTTWDESLAASKDGRCQILSFLNESAARDEWLIFTDPIFFDQNIIITREEHPYIGDLRGLRDETVALPRGTMIEERVRQDFPDLRLVLTDSEAAAMALVSERQADMTIRSLIVAAYTIKREGLFNLKIAGQLPDYTNRLRIGVRKDLPVLRDILDKGVATITPQHRESISNRHASVNVQTRVDYTLVWKVVAAALLVLVVIVAWNRKLSRLNRELERLSTTDKLTGLFNRLKLDEALEHELDRTRRFDVPLGVILLDIDHFKQVNDRHGHQVGDQVLAQVAGVLSARTRSTDIVGRWGGEEFLVICPQTDVVGTMTLAESLRGDLARQNFGLAGAMTASFGITTFRSGDEAKDMVARADAALYAAKRGGRDRVIVAPDGATGL